MCVKVLGVAMAKNPFEKRLILTFQTIECIVQKQKA